MIRDVYFVAHSVTYEVARTFDAETPTHADDVHIGREPHCSVFDDLCEEGPVMSWTKDAIMAWLIEDVVEVVIEG